MVEIASLSIGAICYIIKNKTKMTCRCKSLQRSKKMLMIHFFVNADKEKKKIWNTYYRIIIRHWDVCVAGVGKGRRDICLTPLLPPPQNKCFKIATFKELFNTTIHKIPYFKTNFDGLMLDFRITCNFSYILVWEFITEHLFRQNMTF